MTYWMDEKVVLKQTIYENVHCKIFKGQRLDL